MPGIFGIFDMHRPLGEDPALSRMESRLRYRGDYRSYCWRDVHCAMGGVTPPYFNAITSEARCLEPPVCLVMEGEIFNRKELSGLLGLEKDVNAPDLMLAAYERWGTGLVDRVNGSFVVVIYEARSRALTFITDRAGSHLLHYAVAGSRVIFSSELKALLCADEVKREIDPAAIVDFFSWGFVLGPRTFVRGVALVPPATIVRISDGKVLEQTHWRWPAFEQGLRRSVADITAELNDTIAMAVRRQLDCGGRAGIGLSGGLDSRILAAHASRVADALVTFTFGDVNSDEVQYARRVAATLGLANHHVRYSLLEFASAFESVVWMNEGLINTPEYSMLAKTAAGCGMQVLLTGNGGDDLSGRHLARVLPRMRDVEAAKEQLFAPSSRLNGSERIFGPSLRKHLPELRRESFEASLAGIDRSDAANLVMQHHARNQLWKSFTRNIDLARYWLRHRQPYFDYDLIDLFARIPPSIRLHEKAYRRVLIEYFPPLADIPLPTHRVSVRAERYLYPYYKVRNTLGHWALPRLHRVLRHMAPPSAVVSYNYEAYRGPLRDYVRSVVLEGNRRRGYFDQSALGDVLAAHNAGTGNHSFLIHKLITFELFQRMFIDPAQPIQQCATA